LRYDPRAERATRDIVSRAIFEEIRAGNTTPHGGVHIQMHHLGPDNVRRLFKGMVDRCADCGFDLAGGLVEVIPTAHYMMGGVVFRPDCSTDLPGLFAAGEDTGGVHGGNRLGGNGVANSTVFGGIAGDTMAAWVPEHGRFAEPNDAEIAAAVSRAETPFKSTAGDIPALREQLYDLMWEDVGILRDRASLQRALGTLGDIDARLDRVGVATQERAFNLTWHDWLNLRSLILVSRAIATAGLAREESRGAHYRTDFPATTAPGDLTYSRVKLSGGDIALDWQPVRFTRVKPGESLLRNDAA
jgi:fumarate reductase flavoprotein subunit